MSEVKTHTKGEELTWKDVAINLVCYAVMWTVLVTIVKLVKWSYRRLKAMYLRHKAKNSPIAEAESEEVKV